MTQSSSIPPRSGGELTAESCVAGDDVVAYDRIFWIAYLANGLVTLCNATMFRYADFVYALGGDEGLLGLIVGLGMLGSIFMRLVQGVAIDHYGSARVWQLCMAVYTVSLVAHLGLSTAHGPAIFLVRAVMQSSLAGVFGASITFVSLRVPAQRTAEIIGTLGTSGFLGILVGPVLADWLCGGADTGVGPFQRLLLVISGIAVLGTIATWYATRSESRVVPRRQPRLSQALQRYTPWMTALVGAAMGAGFSIPLTFLRPFAKETHIEQIGTYFVVYAVTAFIARVSTRQMFVRYGNRPWILVGMGLLTSSYLLYIQATRLWHLMFPAAVAGVAHALLFPSVMASGTSAFPRRLRGIATSVMLAMFDSGTFLGAPVVGMFLREAKLRKWAAYPTMFAGTAVVFAVITLVFWLRPDKHES